MPANPSSLRIVVTGLVGAFPVGGVAWDYLQYPIGLARLGHDVVYHEDTWTWPYDPVKATAVDTASYSVDFLKTFFNTYAPELSGRWHYRHLNTESFGMSESAFQDFARSADLCLNVSAANPLPPALNPHCVKALLDTDPGYNQVVLSERPEWSQNIERWIADFVRYDRYLTYAENIGQPDCLVPTLDVDWITTRMPIVTDVWRDLPPAPRGAPWSTVMTWGDFRGPLIYAGHEYGSKGVEFTKFASLPRLNSHPFKIAIGGRAPRESVAKQGWTIVDAPSVTLTPASYQRFITESRGEFSTAKNVYVAMKTGWFSCRTACYLAAGRPAVVQDTGFSKTVPVGRGLLAFETLEEASAGLDAIEADYGSHAEAARDLAADQFGSDKVLTRLLDDIFASSRRA